jgi:PhnB protein
MKRKVKRKKAVAKKVQPIPAGYTAVTPYLAVRGAAAAIDFYRRAFGAKEKLRMPFPDGKLAHAEIQIGDARVLLSDEFEPMALFGPQTRGGTTVMIHLYVKNVDAIAARAAEAGGKVVRPVADQFYGDRTCLVEDPFGHRWYIATHTVDLTKAELKKRAMAMAAAGG